MRSRQLGLVAAVLLLAACGPRSQVAAMSDVTLSGAVQTQDGQAAAPTTVQLIRHPDALQAISEVVVAIGSVGLACVGGRLDICKPFQQAPSAADGSYHFSLKGSDTQGSVGEALTFTVFAPCAAQPAPATKDCAVAADFIVQKNALTVPPLQAWSALGSVAVDAGSGNPSFSWPALESKVGGAPASDYRVTLSDSASNLMWSADAKNAAQLVLDRRVTQDWSGSWLVTAQRTQSMAGTDFHFSWYSSAQAYTGQDLNPLSRTADCWLQGPSGPVRVTRPCPLTDADLGTKLQPLPAPTCPAGQTCPAVQQNNWVAVDLGFSHPMALLVLYDLAVSTGTSSMIAVETSNDMTTWASQATVAPTPYQVVPLDGTANQYLRLRVVDPQGQFTSAGNSAIAIYPPGV